MSDRTVRRILHEDFNFSPYKIVMVEAVNDQDTVNRKTVCEVLLNAPDNDDHNHVLMTDEAYFHLCGNASSQNCRYWSTENPRYIHQKPIHSEKFIVWCGVAALE
jgi:nicotinic acid phosphoribosyltransferase